MLVTSMAIFFKHLPRIGSDTGTHPGPMSMTEKWTCIASLFNTPHIMDIEQEYYWPDYSVTNLIRFCTV